MNTKFLVRSAAYSLFAATAVECGFYALLGSGQGIGLLDLLEGPGFWIPHAVFAGAVGARMWRKLEADSPSRRAVTAVTSLGPIAATMLVSAVLLGVFLEKGLLPPVGPGLFAAAAAGLGLINGLGYPLGAVLAAHFTPQSGIPDSGVRNPDASF